MTLPEYKQALYQANREARLEHMKLYYAANRERLVQYQRDYRAKKHPRRAKEPATAGKDFP